MNDGAAFRLGLKLAFFLWAASSLLPIHRPREAYGQTGYGLPLAWILVQTPNRAVAKTQPHNLVLFRPWQLVFDFCVAGFVGMTLSAACANAMEWSRRRSNCCTTCGYSRRGMRNRRCPESGTRNLT